MSIFEKVFSNLKPRILLIDDDQNLSFVLSEALQSMGAEVEVAYTGKEGLDKAISMNPDVVIADINMPIMTGEEMLMQLRQKNFTRPVIILSGQSDLNLAVMAFRYGVFDFLIKPTSNELLKSVVLKAMQDDLLKSYNEFLKEDLFAELLKMQKPADEALWREQFCARALSRLMESRQLNR